MQWLEACVSLLAFSLLVTALPEARQSSYEYIVVGSGAGGGPLAARLARAGHSTLLIEAGDDQGGGINLNTSIPGFQAAVTQDPKIRWDFYVSHYLDQARAEQDPKYVYDIGGGQQYVGLNPPAGAEPLGILYPRAGTLGGCVSHNALIWITPHDSDWNYIQNITGDNSWSAANMRQYLDKVYDHQPVAPTDPTILTRDLKLVQHLAGGASEAGVPIDPAGAVLGVTNALLSDPNSRVNPDRDSAQGFYQIPLIAQNGSRKGVRDFVVETVQGGYPLTIKSDTFVTRVLWNTTTSPPRAIGVEYLEGKYLYRASPYAGESGTNGSVTASKEVILSGGTFNTVQMLKLSGVGPAAELNGFGIEVISNLPGVGINMQDRYEIPVSTKHTDDFSLLDGCTFDAKPHDKCYTQWINNPNVLAARGAYGSDGLACAMALHSDTADNSDIDLFIFGGPVNFIGYFPQWGDFALRDHQHFSWYTLKAHTRNKAGTVKLRSTDPLDTPVIDFNYFDTGTTTDGADQKDLAAIVEAVKKSRAALQRYYNYSILGGSSFVEEHPGPSVDTDEEIGDYIKTNAWGHHACGTAAIGADNDPNAVLDSKFRVRGVQGLRVVDASVFPKIPGVFIQAPTAMIAEKAADVILNG